MTQPDRFQSLNYYSPPPSPPPSLPGSKISPAVLFAIVILALLFFVSALLHLLVRLLTKHPNSSSSNGYPQGQALQRQLQQLFNLNDSGLEQAFIDALPVFLYSEAVLGAKEPFDCAVCLTEFSDTDKLRLLPTCSHAFHISCIDTWLLSNSTCPLCRAMLFAPGFPMENPIFEVDAYPDEEDGCSANVNFQKRVEIEEEEGALSVRLGKFRKLDGGDTNLDLEEASDRNVDARRCYSMGSYEYVLGDTSLKVALCPNQHRKNSNSNLQVGGDSEGSRSISRGDSYSVSKIWLWPKKGDLSGDARIERTWDV